MTANEKLAREWMIKTFLPDSSEWVDVKAQSLTALLDTVAAGSGNPLKQHWRTPLRSYAKFGRCT